MQNALGYVVCSIYTLASAWAWTVDSTASTVRARPHPLSHLSDISDIIIISDILSQCHSVLAPGLRRASHTHSHTAITQLAGVGYA
eukprot:scaffold7621_cov135-Isochrysis_galbana.AAC.3